MGTNFYWKTIPQEILDIIGNTTQYALYNPKQKQDINEMDSIFKHIGKRSASGYYCYRCGITFCKQGAWSVHQAGPDYSLLLNTEGLSSEQKDNRKREFDRQKAECVFSKCPCCGATAEDNKGIVDGSCSFNWTMMLHKNIIINHINDDTLKIVNEYDEEFTCKQFLDDFSNCVVMENQTAWEFS